MNNFKRFLIRNNIYNEFIENYSHLKQKDPNEFIKKHDFGCALAYSFCWADSKQGHNFWSKYSKMMTIYYRKLRKEEF